MLKKTTTTKTKKHREKPVLKHPTLQQENQICNRKNKTQNWNQLDRQQQKKKKKKNHIYITQANRSKSIMPTDYKIENTVRENSLISMNRNSI